MAALSVEAVRVSLRGVLFPNFQRDIVRLGMVDDVRVDGGTVQVSVRPGSAKPDVLAELRSRIAAVVGRLEGVTRVEVQLAGAEAGRSRDPFAERATIPGVKHVVAVSSAKGGVGKSTVAVNLAVALRGAGASVGLADLDVYGPSLPIMLRGEDRPAMTADKRIRPVVREGVRCLSMGYFLNDDSPVIWRGPIVMGIVRQFLREVEWGPTDVLVIDLPPGTGDAPLTLVQQVPLAGGVVVTTPQDVALADVARGIAMFAQVQTPVFGVIENMSGYTCPRCGTEDPVFGLGGGERLTTRYDLPLLARIPLVPAIRISGDAGRPIVVAEPDHPASRAFREAATAVMSHL